MRTRGLAIQQMSVDELTERISIVYYESSRNSYGGIVRGEELTRCELWAKVLPLTGKINDITPERINAVTYRITIRYRTDIKPDDEIKWRDKKLKITTPPIDVESYHKWTQLDCRELRQDGTNQ